MMQMYKTASNPQAFVQSMMVNNPKAMEVMNAINACGGDPKAAFYNVAKQKGIDPEQFLNSLL